MAARVAVIGAGFVGLPTAVVLALNGNSVVVDESDQSKCAVIASGISPHYEEGLQEALTLAQSRHALTATTDLAKAAGESDMVILCVPTPSTQDGADLRIISTVVRQLRDIMASNSILVIKSTVPCGTTQMLIEMLNRSDIRVVNCPEFLRTGAALYDTLNPERLIIGSIDGEGASEIEDLYRFTNAPVVSTTLETSELIKYAANLFLAMKISFINEMARISDAVGGDIGDVKAALGYDNRIGGTYLSPGPGWGGSCFPKDIRALTRLTQDLGIGAPLVMATHASNETHLEYLLAKVERELIGIEQPTIAVFGLAFKAGTNEMRDSPALRIVNSLSNSGFSIHAYDPVVRGDKELAKEVLVFDNAYEAAEGASLLLILTEWEEFHALDWSRVGEAMAHRVVLDARYHIDRDELAKHGWKQISIGSKPSHSLETVQ